MIDTKKLRQKILDLAIRGKLVPQDPNDEPASVLLERIRAEKDRLIAEGKIKRDKKDSYIFRGDDNLHYEKIGDAEPVCIEDEIPFEIPESWEWVRLGRIVQILNGDRGKNYPAKNKLTATAADGKPFVSAVNIEDGMLDVQSLLYLSLEQYQTLRAGKFGHGDLLLCIRGSIGKCAIVQQESGAIASSLVIIRSTPLCNLQEYVKLYIDSPLFMTETSRFDNGTAQPNLSAGNLANFLLPLPPAQAQVRIIQTFGIAQSSVNSIEESQQKLQGLAELAKAKILDLAIRGKLVPQDPSDEPASVLLERIRAEKERLTAEGTIKRDKKESYIFRGDDNSYYLHAEKTDVGIDDQLPFELPESWQWCQLGQVSNYGEADSVAAERIPDEAWVLDLEDIEKDSGRIIKRVTKAERDFVSTKHPFSEGQLLYSKLRPYLNKVLVAPENGFCTSEILPITLFGETSPSYIKTYLMSEHFLQYANQCSYGVKMPRLGTYDGRQAYISFPPFREEMRIAGQVNAVATLLELLKREE